MCRMPSGGGPRRERGTKQLTMCPHPCHVGTRMSPGISWSPPPVGGNHTKVLMVRSGYPLNPLRLPKVPCENSWKIHTLASPDVVEYIGHRRFPRGAFPQWLGGFPPTTKALRCNIRMPLIVAFHPEAVPLQRVESPSLSNFGWRCAQN